MEKEFVSYSEAVNLKKLGFDEPCFGYYENQNENLVINYNNSPLTEEQQKRPGLYKIDNRNSKLPQWATTAPTYPQAFKWFRDKYKLLVIIGYCDDDDGNFTVIIDSMFEDIEFTHTPSVCKTYEEAELACLKKLIEIVKEKNNL